MPTDPAYIIRRGSLWANVGLCPCYGGDGWAVSATSANEARRWIERQG